MPDDLDLDEHDEPQSRGPRSSRDGRRAPRDFLHDEDGGGRARKSVSRRDDARDERRRVSRREGTDNGGTPAGSPGASGFQRDRSRPLPYASGGARVAEYPRAPYGDRSPRSDVRPGGSPPYGSRTPDSRGPGFRTDRPMNAPYRPGPATGRPERQDRRDGHPPAPRLPGAETRPVAPQQNRYPQQEPRRGYGDRPAWNARPGVPQSAGNTGFRRPDVPSHRPVLQRDVATRARSDKPDEEATRP